LADVGEITARLRIDAAEWQRGLQQAIQSLQQFGQAKDRIIANLSTLQQSLTTGGQTFQQFNAFINQTQQTFNQLNQQFNQTNQTLNQTNQQFNQTNQTFNQTNQTLNVLNQTINNITNNFNNANRSAQGASSAWSSILQIAGGIGLATTIQGIVRALSNFVQESVALAASMENLHRSFTAIQGSGAAANQTLTVLFTTAQRAGISFTDATEGFRRLQAGAASTVLTTQDLLTGFDNISRGATVMGLSTNQVSHAIAAFEQMLTKGRLSAEELVRQLGNAVPGGLARTAAGLGITTERLRQMAEAGVIPSTIAFTAFQAEMGKMADAAGRIDGIAASFVRLKNEMTAWMTAIGGWIGDKILPLVKGITDLSAALRDLLSIPVPGVTSPAAPGAPGAPLPIAPSPYTPLIQQEARRQGIDPGLLSQLVRAESNFDPNVTSRAGARGLGQVMLGTAQGLEMGVTAENITEPERNLRLSAKYLAEMLEKFRNLPDQVKLALAAYNAGPGAVEAAIKAARMAGTPTTYEGIASRLPGETQTYVGNVLSPPGGLPGAQPTAAGTTEAIKTNTALTENWRKELEAALKQFSEIQRQVEALAKSGMNFNGILSQGINQQATRLVERLSVISNFFAAFPDEAKQMSDELRTQSEAAFRQAAIWKESLLTETQRRDLARQQVEQLEQVIVRQQTQLVAQRQGQEEAERFARAETARLQAARIDERVVRAGLTLTQQIARDEQRFQALQNRSAQFSSEQEALRVEAMRPQLESQLQRIQGFIGRPDQSLAEQARQQVITQGAAAQAELVKLIQETARHPALKDLQETFQNAFQALPEAVEKNAAKAFAAVERQTRDTLRGLTDQVDQITMQLGTVGLDPLAADLARIDRGFAGVLDKVQALDASLERLGIGATAEQQVGITALRERLSLITEARIEEGRLAAERERRDRDLLQMREHVERNREGLLNPDQRESTRMRQRLARGGFTQEGQREAQALLVEQERLERVVQVVGIWRDLSQGVGSAWVNALSSIADGTQTVSQAFEAMGKSIMKTMADIAAQQAFQAIFKLGTGLILGALSPTVTPAAAAGSAYSASAGTTSYGAGAFYMGLEAQGGAVINRPTTVLMGENPAMNPEYVLNRHQMDQVMNRGNSGSGSNVTIMNYPSKEQAQENAARERAAGREVILNEVMSDLRKGSGSSIGRMFRQSQT
jgi:tape measure domain-containing protein